MPQVNQNTAQGEVVVRQPLAPDVTPRPALAADDPRALRWRTDYESRMVTVNDRAGQNIASREAAKEVFDKANAAHATAVEEFNAAQAKLIAAKAEQHRASDAYSRLGNPAFVQPTPAEIMSPGEDTVLMVFPTNVTIQANTPRADGVINGTRSATFPEGIQEVPASLQNHPYLIAHNVLPYGGPRIDRHTAPRRAGVTQEQRDTAKKTYDDSMAAAQTDEQRTTAQQVYDRAVADTRLAPEATVA